ncbi:MAG: diguanylate cyclase [Gaiellaceae bacterium]
MLPGEMAIGALILGRLALSHTVLAIIAVAAGLGVVLLALSIASVGRRARRREGERVAALTSRLEARLDEFARDLAEATGQAEEERRWRPFLDEVAESVDLDEVLKRTLEAAQRLPGADAALISLETQDGPPILAASGLPAESIELPLYVPRGRGGEEHRSIELSFRYADDDPAGEPDGGDEPRIHHGLGVPLADSIGRLGFLTVYSCERRHRFGSDELHRLEQLAERAAPAIENARRFREARQLADLDALTGMHNRRFFHQALEREVSRARRYDRALALIIIDLDDFKQVNDTVGHLAGDEVLAVASERIQGAVRTADIPCRIGGDEFAIILPESGLADAHLLFSRIEDAIASAPVGQAERLGISGGIAELAKNASPTDFFDAADEALYRAKHAGKAQSAVSSRTV